MPNQALQYDGAGERGRGGLQDHVLLRFTVFIRTNEKIKDKSFGVFFSAWFDELNQKCEAVSFLPEEEIFKVKSAVRAITS